MIVCGDMINVVFRNCGGVPYVLFPINFLLMGRIKENGQIRLI